MCIKAYCHIESNKVQFHDNDIWKGFLVRNCEYKDEMGTTVISTMELQS
jgi:hypothetical protein